MAAAGCGHGARPWRTEWKLCLEALAGAALGLSTLWGWETAEQITSTGSGMGCRRVQRMKLQGCEDWGLGGCRKLSGGGADVGCRESWFLFLGAVDWTPGGGLGNRGVFC